MRFGLIGRCLLVALGTALLFAACGGGDTVDDNPFHPASKTTGESGSTTATSPPSTSGTATSMLLETGDLTGSWSQSSSGDPLLAALIKCDSASGLEDFASRTFIATTGVALSEEVEVFESTAQAAGAVTGLPGRTDCVAKSINTGALNGGGTTFSRGSSGFETFGQVGDRAAASRISFHAENSGGAGDGYDDVAVVVKGNVAIVIGAIKAGGPVGNESLANFTKQALDRVK